jgi:hypothetical protein
LGEKSEIVILHPILGVEKMLAVAAPRDQAGIEIVIPSPAHVVAIQAVFLDTHYGRLVWIIAESLCGQCELVKQPAMAVLRIHHQRAPQEPYTVAEVDAAAVLFDASANSAEAVSSFKAIDNIVVLDICPQWFPGQVGARGYRSLREDDTHDHDQESGGSHKYQRRKFALAFDP